MPRCADALLCYSRILDNEMKEIEMRQTFVDWEKACKYKAIYFETL